MDNYVEVMKEMDQEEGCMNYNAEMVRIPTLIDLKKLKKAK